MSIIREVTIGNCRLIQADNRDVLPGLTADAIVTDPPFGIKRDKGMGGGGKSYAKDRSEILRAYDGEWDDERPEADVFALMRQVTPVQIIWGGQFFADLLPAQGKWLWWDKCQTMPSFGDGELAWTSLPGDAVKKFVYNGSGLHAKEKGRVHPTQKPVALMEWCLGFLPHASVILDPFMGSGSTGCACVNLGRHFIGIEKSEVIFRTAVKRITDAHRQADLFVSKPQYTPPVQEPLL